MSEPANLATELGLVAAAGWLGALARVVRPDGNRALTWRTVLIETPGAVACGLVGGGIATALGINHPVALAGAAAAAGKLGSAALLDLALLVLRRNLNGNGGGK